MRSRLASRRPDGSRCWAPRCQFASTACASWRWTAASKFWRKPRSEVARASTGHWGLPCGNTSNVRASSPTIASRAGVSIGSWMTSSPCKHSCLDRPRRIADSATAASSASPGFQSGPGLSLAAADGWSGSPSLGDRFAAHRTDATSHLLEAVSILPEDCQPSE